MPGVPAAALRVRDGRARAWPARSRAVRRSRRVSGRHALWALLIGLLTGGLALAALRVDLIRVRYAGRQYDLVA